MDSCCNFSLGTKTVLAKDSFKNVENKFLGEKIKGSVLKPFSSDLSSKNFRNRKLRPGVAYAIATSKNAKEALVSSMIRFIKTLDHLSVELVLVIALN